jgi:cytoskeleton protein RodZ
VLGFSGDCQSGHCATFLEVPDGGGGATAWARIGIGSNAMETQRRRLFKRLDPNQLHKSHFLDIEGGPEVDALIGQTLRRAREAWGYDLQQVSEALRIRRAHLEALEEGRYDDLPGSTYALGFFRSYARFLGLDADAIVEQLKTQSENLVKETKLDFPVPSAESRTPRLGLVVVALLLAALAYGGWRYLVAERDLDAALVLENPPSEILPPPEPSGLAPAEEQAVPLAGPAIAFGPIEELAQEPVDFPGSPAGEAPVSEEDLGITAEAAPSDVAAPSGVTPSNELGAAEVPADAGELAPPIGGGALSAAAPEVAFEEPNLGAPVVMAPAEEDFAELAPAEAMPPAAATSEGLEPSLAKVAQEPVAPAPEVETTAPEVSTAEVSEVEAIPGLEPEAATVPAPGYGEPGGRITITATADSWIEVKGPDGEVLFTRTLRAGEVYYVPNRAGLRFTTGNAGGLEIRVDSRLTPPLGGMGIVRRNIPLDPVVLVERAPPQP